MRPTRTPDCRHRIGDLRTLWGLAPTFRLCTFRVVGYSLVRPRIEPLAQTG